MVRGSAPMRMKRRSVGTVSAPAGPALALNMSQYLLQEIDGVNVSASTVLSLSGRVG